MKLNIQDTFNKKLPADPILENSRRKVKEACFSFVKPKTTSNPKVLHVSLDMANNLGISEQETASIDFRNIITGNKVIPDTNPYAMCYGGYQFGHWAGQLGDGRAINLGEILHNNKLWALQLKGAGPTPYSRSADGLAVLRSSVREYLCSEAMYYLGVPTTRALSLALTGDQVMRDMLYDGNAAYEKGAIVSRVAPTFIRFGNFEILAANQDIKTLKTLVDYTIKHFFSNLGTPSKETYLSFFSTVAKSSLDMVIHWQRVGFVHGVMNTDNMSILGLTIDYGPYGWLEDYNVGWTPNTTDRQHKRYRFGSQPDMVLWNLYKLANALYPLIEETEGLEKILNNFRTSFGIKYKTMMLSKLGLEQERKEDITLIKTLESNLQLTETDMTLFFRLLSQFNKNDSQNGLDIIKEAFYKPNEITDLIRSKWQDWFDQYTLRLLDENIDDHIRIANMNSVNPKYVLRNYMAQLAIDAANKGDNTIIDELFQLLKKPYEEQTEHKKWFAKRPEWARHKIGCSMLSCSS